MVGGLHKNATFDLVTRVHVMWQCLKNRSTESHVRAYTMQACSAKAHFLIVKTNESKITSLVKIHR